MLFDGVDRQLTHEPTKVTRQRAPLRDELGNPTTYWKLRIGALRVYYYVESKPKASVNIVAIGRKEGEQVRIGSQLIKMDELISWLNQEG